MTDIIRSPEMYRRDRILDDWLEQIETGQATVEECLAQHPELRAEMEPVLRSARQLFAGEVTPLSAAKVRAIRGRVLDRVPPAAQQRAPSGSLWFAPAWTRLAGVVAVLLLVLGVGLAGVWRVSADSLPGNPLYLVKRGAESVQLAFAGNPANSARLHLTFALRRLDEGLGLKQPERTMAEAAGELQRAAEALNQAHQLGAPIDWDAVARLSATGERELAGVAGGDPATVQAAGILHDLQQRARRQGSGGPAASTAVPAPSAPPTEPRGTPPPTRPAPSDDARSTGAPDPATSSPGPGGDRQGGPGYYGPPGTPDSRPGAETSGPAETSQPKLTPRATAGVEAPIQVTRANAGGVRGVFATATSRAAVTPTAVPTEAPTVEPAVGPEQGQGNAAATPANPTGGQQTSGGGGGGGGNGSGGQQTSGGGGSGSGGNGGSGSGGNGGGGGGSGGRK